jgi:diaminopropionate ammonia-lyase
MRNETQMNGCPLMHNDRFSHVFIKDESTRFGLPSFKILGASWAIHQALCKRLGLPNTVSFQVLAKALNDKKDDIRLVTCTEGNWGRACARMAKYLNIPCRIYVPWFMNDYTQGLLRGEGADVHLLSDGSYDDTIAAAKQESETSGSLLVMDTSWDGYTEFPQWVTDGYSTMLTETDRQVAAQTNGKAANIAFVSVGVGSWAHSVVSHFKAANSSNRIVTVEPTAAPSLKESLHCGKITPIETGETIMNGMNCGTTSSIAWPVLRDGTYAAVTISDIESHECVQYLQSKGVNAGPCGAANLAALRKLCVEHDLQGENKVVVLFSTEGSRDYEVPV